MVEISIVVPLYNTKPEYFLQALNSIQIQEVDLHSIDVSVHDDGSDPRLSKKYQKIIRQHSPLDITYSKNEKNRGVGYARNRAASNASGEYLLFLDSDDVLHESAARMLVKALEQNQWADAAYSDNVKFTYPEIDFYQYRRKDVYDRYARLFKGTAYNPVIRDTYIINPLCIKKDIFDSLNGYADSAAIGEHSEFLPRLHERSDHHNLLHVPRVLYFRRHLKRSLSSQKRDKLTERTERFLRKAAERASIDISRVKRLGRVSPYQASHYMFYDGDGMPIVPPYLNAEEMELVLFKSHVKTEYYWEQYFEKQVQQHLLRVQTE